MGNNFIIYTDKEVIHANTGIQLDFQNNIPENTKLEANTINSGSSYDKVIQSIGAEYKNLQIYDISLKDETNTKIQPNGKVKLFIPVKDITNTANLEAYRIEENGNKIKYETKIETIDGQEYAVFETDHFSTYVLAEKVLEKQTESNTSVEAQITEQTKNNTSIEAQIKQEDKEHILDNEPKTGVSLNIKNIISIIAVISIVGFIYYKNNKGVE
jgi:uncharacterized protein involved in exopolysaccharide biosynthesis